MGADLDFSDEIKRSFWGHVEFEMPISIQKRLEEVTVFTGVQGEF